jgi:septal ring factor EnvC (AmiA/AmiB activator)
MRSWPHVALVGVFCGLMPVVPNALAQEDEELEAQRQRLEQIQQEIKNKRAEAARLGEREESVIRELRQVERELGVTEQLVATLGNEIESRGQQIEEVSRSLARAHDELALKRQVLARRLRAIYKLGRFGVIEILFRSDSFADALSRYKYLRLIAEQDGRLLDRITRLEVGIKENLVALGRAREELDHARAARMRHAEELSATEGDRQRMLAVVKGRRSEQLRAAQALEEETGRIQQLLVVLERRRAEREAEAARAATAAGRRAPDPAASTLTADVGALAWPVEGEIIARFGRAVHPVYKTEVVNNGIDIRAPRGTPVRTVGAGEVAYVDWNGGYGLMVIVDHDGGYYSLYAHLDRADVTVGQQVGQRQVVGAVGETGSLVGAQLHFEIREGGRAIDPIAWLQKR